MHMGNDGNAGYYLVATCGVERDHLVSAPVGKPHPSVVPTGRLAERDARHYYCHVKADVPHGRNSSSRAPLIMLQTL